MKIFKNNYKLIVSPENLFLAWKRFSRDKRKKPDVARFEWKLEKNIFELHRDLIHKSYKHGHYTGFYINDPKQRHIHKATVRDRILHHAIVSVLTSLFEPSFISNSFSCRVGKGAHMGVETVEQMTLKVSKNNTKNCYALKCDVKKFFDTIDHEILTIILGKKIKDDETMWLLEEIIEGFTSRYSNLFERKGIPVGNLTSQLFANVYMNEFDQFMKQRLKVKHYARYTDDFIILSDDKQYLIGLLPRIDTFLREHLRLILHPNKVSLRTLRQGIDFLGYVVLSHHRRVRVATQKRIWKGVKEKTQEYNRGVIKKGTLRGIIASYLGVLSHANSYTESEKLKNQVWFWIDGV